MTDPYRVLICVAAVLSLALGVIGWLIANPKKNRVHPLPTDPDRILTWIVAALALALAVIGVQVVGRMNDMETVCLRGPEECERMGSGR